MSEMLFAAFIKVSEQSNTIRVGIEKAQPRESGWVGTQEQ